MFPGDNTCGKAHIQGKNTHTAPTRTKARALPHRQADGAADKQRQRQYKAGERSGEEHDEYPDQRAEAQQDRADDLPRLRRAPRRCTLPRSPCPALRRAQPPAVRSPFTSSSSVTPNSSASRRSLSNSGMLASVSHLLTDWRLTSSASARSPCDRFFCGAAARYFVRGS